MPRVVVLGSGFAALAAVRALRARCHRDLDITLVAPKAEFVYLPSLIWLPSGLRRPEDLLIPLDRFFRRMRVTFHAGTVTGLADGGRTVKTSTGDVANDGLIIATGGRFIKKLPGIEHALTPCDGIAPVMAFKERLDGMDGGTLAFGFAGNPNEPAAMRGGPIFEFLFGTDRMLRRQGRRDRFEIVFFSPAPKPGIRLGEKVVPKLLDRMQALGIRTHLGHKLTRFEDRQVVTEGGAFAADVILFMPGLTGNAWFDGTELPRSPGGMVRADAQCRVAGWDKVYVAGDSGSFPGPDWMPKQAHMADLQAAAAARNLLAEFRGRPADRTFRTELICIIDDNSGGVLVARNPSRTVVLPRLGVMHWSKRIFEWQYLRKYR